MKRCLAALTPFGAVLDNPVGKRPLETNVPSRFLGLYPLVLEDLFTFIHELAIKRRVLQQFVRRGGIFRFVRHKLRATLISDTQCNHYLALLTIYKIAERYHIFVLG